MSDIILLDIQSGAGMKRKVAFETTRDNQAIHHAHFLDVTGAAPTVGIANGWQYTDGLTATRLKGFVRQNGAWVAMILTHILEANLDFDRKQAVKMLCEKLAVAVTPASADEARVIYNTALKLLQVTRATDTLTVPGIVVGSQYIDIPMDLALGSATPGDTVAQGGSLCHRLDVSTEEITATMVKGVPLSWVGNQDLIMRVRFALGAAETAADDIVADADWVTLDGTNDNVLTQAAQAATQVTKDIGTGNAINTIHDLDFIIDHDAVGNVVAVGDTIRAQISSTLVQIAQLLIVKAWMRVPVNNVVDS